MIDLNAARKDPDRWRGAFKSRGGRHLPVLEELLRLDADYRKELGELEQLRSRRNAASQAIGKAKASRNEAEAARLMEEVGRLKDTLKEKEDKVAVLEPKVRELSLSLPNSPHESSPLGSGEQDNKPIRSGPKPKEVGFKPMDHQGLGEKLGILDFAAAAGLSGSRFALWRGAGARLLRAIISFQLDRHIKAGYEEIWPPSLVRPEILVGTGQLPKFEADLYKTQSGEEGQSLYLIPTAEVPLTNLVRERILSAESLPLKWTAYTPCFRQEAGSYGKDVRGLIRNHQFDKVEMVWITRPEDSPAALEQLTQDAEGILKALEIPYRVIELCTADLGFASRKTYDLEVWMPAEGRYREISSCSDCGDFQARRMNARFRLGPDKSPEFVHTLNGSGVAVGRLAAAILENFQNQDGSVTVPAALRPYFGGDRIQALRASS
ncbi:MAG: serine--tRNA ligase [Elusimicrobia bacterium]|nr:serine--tRNA ligase [Elusimicrobiota bacterium]